MQFGLALLNRFHIGRKPQAPDSFERRLGLLCRRVPRRLPAAGMSVFRMQP